MSEPKPAETPSPAEAPKFSPAELKKKAKAEKQARRAAQKEQQAPEGASQGHAAQKADSPAPKPKAEKQQAQKQGDPRSKKPTDVQHGSLPVRTQESRTVDAREAAKDSKQLDLLRHLSSQPRRQTTEGVPKDVHPSILTLGFKMSSYEICGSTARCVAMLLALKDAIPQYSTPDNTVLSRHLPSHYLSRQIDFLKSCRPISESMGNAIRWLKNLIIKIDPSTSEQKAKEYICDSIDNFISERIVFTDQMIANEASKQIENGAVVLTYAKSAVVEKTLLQAHAAQTRFRVLVVDSRPLFEGKTLATSLMRAGLNVTYLAYNGIQHAVRQATMVLLGAHSLLSNGMLQSRIGTSSIAMAAAAAGLPVLVCCESVKFSGKSVLDSLVLNEVAPPEELLLPNSHSHPLSSQTEKDEAEQDASGQGLHSWRDINNLQVLNLMYDVTPAEYLTHVVCEYGNISPESVQAIHQMRNEGDWAV